ncbi:PREDICTED: branched-chain-amino-acid aminotransferase, mitochondrial [Myotis davidii]|uniref:branched-chain-amino-acid aminotransferase, mitochondrial n=1 Tax=Myotis davidii TaxID=225400 RepID=UPI0007674161|nr:PREDICTED: branched-chain-amino-acid aminotransferase, mitochondrial [Myotis davidii]
MGADSALPRGGPPRAREGLGLLQEPLLLPAGQGRGRLGQATRPVREPRAWKEPVWARKLLTAPWLLGGPRRYASSSFKAADLQLEMTQKPHKKPDPSETLVFGKTFTDHMLMVEWSEKKGWSHPRIQPFHSLTLHPACSALHYSLQVAWPPALVPVALSSPPSRGVCRRVHLPGPASCPPFPRLRRLLSEAPHVPGPVLADGWRLCGWDCVEALGAMGAERARSRAGAGYLEAPLRTCGGREAGLEPWPQAAVLGRGSWVVGHGEPGAGCEPGRSRLGPLPAATALSSPRNYGPTVFVQQEAKKKGCEQVLWLYGPDHQLTEVGTMNIFVYWTHEDGGEPTRHPPPGALLEAVVQS